MPLTVPVSVVVCTDGRCRSLAMLHAALARQTHRVFEVIYVVGPSADGTHEMVSQWAGRQPVKVLQCPERNLSRARNLGIRAASGALVAFIDDDAVPEPEWLANLSKAFARPGTGGAGGAVFDPTGVDYQFLSSVADRLGNAHHEYGYLLEEQDYPFSALFHHAMGANCMFARKPLVEAGGFDEEYEYYLEETDLCCRLVDAGYRIVQRHDAPVHHKFLTNDLRTEDRILVSKYPILKNKLYFALRNAGGHYTPGEIDGHVGAFFADHRRDLEQHVAAGRLDRAVLEAFDRDADRAWRVGRENAQRPRRRTRPPAWFGDGAPFQPWPAPGGQGRSTVVFLAAEGCGSDEAWRRAKAVAADPGRDVHLIVADAAGADDVSFAEGIWIRRRASRYHERPQSVRDMGLPEDVWCAIASVDAEIQRIETLRPVASVIDMSFIGLALGPLRRGRKAGIECAALPSERSLARLFGSADSGMVASVLTGLLSPRSEAPESCTNN